MPYREIYFVDFSGGKLTPDVDEWNWGAMRISDPDPNAGAYVITDHPDDPEGFGYNFRVERKKTTPSNVAGRLSVFVTQPKGPPPEPKLDFSVRLRLQAVFDYPEAEGYDDNDVLHRVSYGTVGATPDADEGLTRPEPWAVGVVVSPNVNLSDDTKIVTTTCQFNMAPLKGGIRLNTPRSLQDDSPVQYLAPLDYYWFDLDGGFPKFIVENFFCGVDVTAHPQPKRVCGLGTFKTDNYSGEPEMRAYSSDVFQKQGNPPIGALGISVVSTSGKGRFKVRLRTFKVSIPFGASWPPA